MESIGTRVAAKLKEVDISEAELARRVGVSQQSINQLINGEVARPRYLLKLAIELGTSARWLEQGDSDGEAAIRQQILEIVDSLEGGELRRALALLQAFSRPDDAPRRRTPSIAPVQVVQGHSISRRHGRGGAD